MQTPLSACPSVTIGGRTLYGVYRDLLPPPSPEERAELKANIAENGVIIAVITDEHDAVIDGWTRSELAAEIGLKEIPIDVRRGLSPEKKKALAAELNIHRRHLSKEYRSQRALELRLEGKSYREIAEKIGSSEATVRRDLSTASFDAVQLPTTIKGRDNKERPASMPKPPPAQRSEAPSPKKPASKSQRPCAECKELFDNFDLIDANDTEYCLRCAEKLGVAGEEVDDEVVVNGPAPQEGLSYDICNETDCIAEVYCDGLCERHYNEILAKQTAGEKMEACGVCSGMVPSSTLLEYNDKDHCEVCFAKAGQAQEAELMASFAEELDEEDDLDGDEAPAKKPVYMTSEKQDWTTPEKPLSVVRQVGPIILDPCSNPRSIVAAKIAFEEKDDGLSKPWAELAAGGLIFMNPPYKTIRFWMKKAWEEYQLGANLVLCIPARPQTKWWWKFVWRSEQVCFWKGAIPFDDGRSKINNAPFASAFVLMSRNEGIQSLFTKAFKPHGCIVWPALTSYEWESELERLEKESGGNAE